MATAMAKVGKAKLRSISWCKPFRPVGDQKSCWRERRHIRHLPFVLACLLKPDPQQLLCAQFLCPLAVMFRFAVSATLCLHLLPGHAMCATKGADASGSCDAKTFAGWTSPPNYGASIRDGVTHGLCGYEADTTEEKCSTYYAEGLQDGGTFYQCRWLSATGKSGKQVNLCVTWSAENKR